MRLFNFGLNFINKGSRLSKLNLNSGIAASCQSLLQSKSFNMSDLKEYSVKVGDQVPSVDVYETTPATTVNIREFCSNRKVLIFAVPGAFTPGCSKTHLPGYIANYDKIKEKGIAELACISINDAFVMDAWGQAQGTKDKIRMFADTNGELTNAMGVGQELAVLGGLRSKRYSMLVDNGIVMKLNVEPDGKGLSCSLAEQTLAVI